MSQGYGDRVLEKADYIIQQTEYSCGCAAQVVLISVSDLASSQSRHGYRKSPVVAVSGSGPLASRRVTWASRE